jgi:hypothetical protein
MPITPGLRERLTAYTILRNARMGLKPEETTPMTAPTKPSKTGATKTTKNGGDRFSWSEQTGMPTIVGPRKPANKPANKPKNKAC